jgi:hypothetical protein
MGWMGMLEKGTDPTMRDENGIPPFHLQVATTRKKISRFST